ncbi:hypothetical protein MPLB_40029 [Mesorhizobium sp. ORS 3324]|nr:hypothetical protein MPLB_40029 [Mesorhizobium sp. ORS 3324]
MADSDNSTTLHPVTRRSLLARTAIAMAGSKPKAVADSVFERHHSKNVMIELADGSTVTLNSLDSLRDMLCEGSVDPAIGAKVEAELLAHQRRWDAFDRAIGYSAALRAESEAADRAEPLLKALSETPAKFPCRSGS